MQFSPQTPILQVMKEVVTGKLPEIPEHWQFPERGQKGLVVAQIDLDQRFLSFTLPDKPGYKNPHYKGEYADYFFDENGNIIDCRTHSYDDTVIELRKSDMGMRFLMGESGVDWLERLEINGIWLLETKPNANTGVLDFGLLDEDSRGWLTYLNFDHISDKEIHSNRLHTVALGNKFRDKFGNIIEAPNGSIDLINSDKRDGLNGFKASHWYWERYGFRQEVYPFEIEYNERLKPDKQEKSNEVFFRDENGEGDIVFRLNWEVEDGQLVISEMHLPTQITRVLRAPVILPMDEIKKAVFSKPPYEKMKDRLSGSEDLVVPWRNIDTTIGVSLAYSRPVPQKET